MARRTRIDQQRGTPSRRDLSPGGRSSEPPPRRPSNYPVHPDRVDSERRTKRNTGRVILTLASVLVLGATWFAWSRLDALNSNLTRADVIDPAANVDNGKAQNILLVGIDTRTDAQGNPLSPDILNQLHAGSSNDGADATDTMMVIHIPAGGQKAVGFSIPRDAYVELAGGYGKHKINSAYTYAETAATKRLRDQGMSGPQLAVDAAQAGAKNAIQTVEQFTGITINHFASVNLVGFYDISQAIGGVTVCLNHAVHDSYSGANFPAGVQTIQGAQALQFVRQRHGLPNGDIDRIKRQQVFMAGMAHSVLSAGTLTDPSKLDRLIGAITGSITLDKDWNVLNFAQELQGITGGNILFRTIPIVSITMKTPMDGDAVEVNPGQVQSFVSNLFNTADSGSAPAPTNSPAPSSPAPAPDNAGITTQVYNATTRANLASQVMNVLTSQGFSDGGTGNSTARSATVVDYAPGDEASAQKVVTALGGNITTVATRSMSTGKVRVYLGRDYSGPQHAQTTPTSPSGDNPPPGNSGSDQAPVTAGGQNCIN